MTAMARCGHPPVQVASAIRDLDQLRSFLSGPGPATIMDLPWVLFFLGILVLLHFWLGVTALVGALILAALAWWTDRSTRPLADRFTMLATERSSLTDTHLRHSDTLRALGMAGVFEELWANLNGRYLTMQRHFARTSAVNGSISKIFRQFLQSSILTVGALLVIDGKASGGVIFASSIISGRALAPIDQAIANWRGFAAARAAWHRIDAILAAVPTLPPAAIALPRPVSKLEARDIIVVPPGARLAAVAGVNFSLHAGNALGIIGSSAAGKSSLGKAITGLWAMHQGDVRLDGATLDQWHPDVLGSNLGYLPQNSALFEGTIAQNIARFAPSSSSAAVLAAAEDAEVHDMIVGLPEGYDTQIGPEGSRLSQGQRQRIALARALYGTPFLVVLDEPNANLDVQGEEALGRALQKIRRRGGIAVVISHRLGVLANMSHVLCLKAGGVEAFGLRDDVLRAISKAKLAEVPAKAEPRAEVAA